MKKILVILMVLTMIISIAGCKKEEKKTSLDPGQSNNKQAEVTQDDDGRPLEGNMYLEGFPIVKEPITIRVAAVDAWNTDNYSTKQIVEEYAKKTNINVIWEHIPYEGKEEKLNLMFASGTDLPDLFLFLDYEKVEELGMEGQLLPVRDLIKQYAPNVETMIEKQSEVEKICRAADGNMYIIPSMYMSPGESLRGSTIINKTWLNTLGLDMPKTVDEYYNVLKAFKEQDPNQNGLADEIPLTLNWENDLYGICSSFGPWNVTSANFGPFFARNQEEIVVSVMEPGYKEAIKFYHKLFKEGLMDNEVFTQDHNKYKSKTHNHEKIIIGSTNEYAPINPSGKVLAKDEYNFVALPPLDGPGGKHHIIPVGGGIFANNYINADTKYAKEIMRWVDGIADPMTSYEWNGGPKDMFWEIKDDGKIHVIEGLKEKGFDRVDYTYLFPIMGIYKEWYEENVAFNVDDQLKVDLIKDVMPVGDQFIVSSNHMGSLRLKFTDEEEFMRVKYYSDLEQYCKNKEAQWIMQGGIDEEWDDYIEQLNKMKIMALKDIYQNAVDKWNGK